MKQNGFTFVETMVALVIATVAILAIAQMWDISFTVTQTTSASTAVTDKVRELRTVFANEAQCTSNLANVALSTTNAAGVSVNSLSQYDDTKKPTLTLATIGDNKEGFTISDIRLRPVAKLSPTTVAADLEIHVQLNNSTRALAVRKIGLLAEVSGGTVQRCWSQMDQTSVNGDQLCSVISGGAFDQVDPATGKCVLGNSQWYGSSDSSATCPEGTTLPPGANGYANCAIVAPPGFVDNYPGSTVPMSDGSVVTIRRTSYFAGLDIPNKTCNCSYATDIGSTSAFQCKILCVKM